MFTLETTDTQRVTISAIGALIVSAACVLSAVSPARYAELTPVTNVSGYALAANTQAAVPAHA